MKLWLKICMQCAYRQTDRQIDHTSTHLHAHAQTHTYTHAHIYIHTHTCTCMYSHILNVIDSAKALHVSVKISRNLKSHNSLI